MVAAIAFSPAIGVYAQRVTGRVHHPAHKIHPPKGQQGKSQEFFARSNSYFNGIEMTPEQKAKIDALNAERYEKVKKERAKVRDKAEKCRKEKQKKIAERRKANKKAREKYMADVRKVLTPEQYAKFEANYKAGCPVQNARYKHCPNARRVRGSEPYCKMRSNCGDGRAPEGPNYYPGPNGERPDIKRSRCVECCLDSCDSTTAGDCRGFDGCPLNRECQGSADCPNIEKCQNPADCPRREECAGENESKLGPQIKGPDPVLMTKKK